MKCYLLIGVGFLFCLNRTVAQAQLDVDHPMLDNALSFMKNSYDIALIRNNKVESCQQNNQTYFFDSSGRVVKMVLITYDSATQVHLYKYDPGGELILTEISGTKYATPIVTTYHKFYSNGLLVLDSSGSGYSCRHLDYYSNGLLRQELWFGLHHRLQRGFWFGIDSIGRITRIIDRDYMGDTDTMGRLTSNRTLFYNAESQMIREEEAVEWEMTNIKSFFCPNGGSATFSYNRAGKLIEIARAKGPSQKITYLDNGLIATIESWGKNCEGTAYHWTIHYKYTYRK